MFSTSTSTAQKLLKALVRYYQGMVSVNQTYLLQSIWRRNGRRSTCKSLSKEQAGLFFSPLYGFWWLHKLSYRLDTSAPKHGKEDPKNEPHVGGNTWAGGTGGRDTAGLGGKGGPYRLDKGHKVHQVSDCSHNVT